MTVKIDGTLGINKVQDGIVTSSSLADSINLSGKPTAATAVIGTSTTQLATTEFATATGNLAVKKGDFILGANVPYCTDANAIASTQWNHTPDTWTGSPYSGSAGSNQGYLFTQIWDPAGKYRLQTFYNLNGAYISAWRQMDNGVWTDWIFDWTYGTKNGNVLINTTTDNGVDKLQVNGSINTSVYNGYITECNGYIPVIGSNSVAYAGYSSSAAAITDLNNITRSGTYNGNGLTNTPVSGWIFVQHMQHSDIGDNRWAQQIATTMGSYNDANHMYIRTKVNGTWTNWVQII